MEKNQQVLYGELISRIWDDEELKKRFIASPEDVLKEEGITVEEGVEYKVIEAPKLVQYVVLPHEGQEKILQLVFKMLLEKAGTSQAVLPEGVEVRIIQNTEDIRYLIIPASPKTLNTTELKLIAGGGATFPNPGNPNDFMKFPFFPGPVIVPMGPSLQAAPVLIVVVI